MSTELIVRDDSRLQVQWTAEAERLRNEALDLSSIVGSVTTQEQQEVAVRSQIALKTILGDCEKARKACKDPVLQFGRNIDGAAKQFCAPLEAELDRVSSHVRDYVAVQESRRRAAEALRLKELADIDRRKNEELAKALTVEEVDKIHERSNAEAQAAPPPLVVVRATNQIVREDWSIEILDIWALARARPECVLIEPYLSKIKELLNAGVRPPGVVATRMQTSTVRIAQRSEPLRIGGDS